MKAARLTLLVLASLSAAVLALTAGAQGAAGRAHLHVQARIPLGGPTGGELAFDGTSILAAVRRNGAQLVRIDPRANRVVRRLRLDPPADTEHFDYHLAVGFGSIWVGENGNVKGVLRVNPALTAIVKRLPVDGPFGVVRGFGSIWSPQFFAYQVSRIDPKTNRISHRLPATGPTAAAVGAGSVWILAHRANQVLRINPKTNKIIARIPLHLAYPGGAERMTFGQGAVWVSGDSPVGGPPGGIVRIDPTTNKQVIEIMLPPPLKGAYYVATGGGYVWAESDNGYLARINPATNSVTGLVHVARKPFCRPSDSGPGCSNGIVYAAGSVWVDLPLDHAVIRVAPQ